MTSGAGEPGALEPVELTGLGIRLRLWREDAADAEAALRGLNDPDFQKWNAGIADEMDAAGARKYIRSRNETWERGDQASFCITEEGREDRALGHIGLHRIERRMGNAGIGYWLLPEARGRGLVTRAVELCVRWAFERVGLHRVDLGHALGNEASCRVADRCGFTPEGVLRGFLPAKEPGVFHDMHLHARLATDLAPSSTPRPRPFP